MNFLTIKNSLFLKILYSYLIILVIPLLLGIVIYYETIRIIENDARESSLSLVEQSKMTMDQNMTDINNLVTQFSLNTDVQNLLNQDSPFKDPTTVSDIQRMQIIMSPYRILNNFIKVFYIYSEKGNLVVSPYTAYIRMNEFYDNFQQYQGYSYNQWKEKYLDTWRYRAVFPAETVKINSEQSSVVTFVSSIDGGPTSKPRGAIIVLIDKKEIQSLITSTMQKSGGWSYVSDSAGNILVSSGYGDYTIEPIQITEKKGYFDRVVNGKQMLITYEISSYNGWHYVSAVPLEMVMAKADSIRRIVVLIFLFSLLLGFIMALMFAYRNSKPLNDLVRSLLGKQPSTVHSVNEYEFLRDIFTAYQKQNQTLSEDLDQQLPLLRNTVLAQLLYGEYPDKQTAEKQMEKVGISTQSVFYAIVIICINDFIRSESDETMDEMNMAKVLIKKGIAGFTNQEYYLYDMDFDKIAMIHILQDRSERSISAIEEFAQRLKDGIQEDYNIHLSLTGSQADNAVGINRAFFEARQAMLYKTPMKNSGLTWYRNRMNPDNMGFYYPLNIELKVTDLVRARNGDEITRLMADLYRKNFQIRKLTSTMTKHLIGALQGTLIRLAEQMEGEHTVLMKEIAEVSERFDREPDAFAAFSTLTALFLRLSENIGEQAATTSAEIIHDVADFIKSNYADSNLCLSSAAAKFNLTEVYLSKTFKDATGENFSKFVERIRMQRAEELLSQHCQVLEVSELTGYNSPHAFRRAYKRIFGKNPTE